MTRTNPFELGLDKNEANFAALSPLSFIERAASVYPDRTALIYGSLRQNWRDTYTRVLMTLLGGLGTLFGPAVGAFVIVTLENELADKVGPWVTVIMGVIFVVCMLAFRRGLVGELLALRGNKAAQSDH